MPLKASSETAILGVAWYLGRIHGVHIEFHISRSAENGARSPAIKHVVVRLCDKAIQNLLEPANDRITIMDRYLSRLPYLETVILEADPAQIHSSQPVALVQHLSESFLVVQHKIRCRTTEEAKVHADKLGSLPGVGDFDLLGQPEVVSPFWYLRTHEDEWQYWSVIRCHSI